MFVIAILSFASGIYLNALYDIPLKFIIPTLILILSFIPFFIRKSSYLSVLLVLVCFMLAGMVRLGVVTVGQTSMNPSSTKEIYDGLVTESSPNTKIIKLTNPGGLAALKVILRTPQALNINDMVRVFGELREINPTFKNPYLLSWKWLKKLEGVSYELRGTIVSITPGIHYVHSVRSRLKQKIDASGAKYGGIIKALTIGDTTGLDEETKNCFFIQELPIS